MDNISSDFFTSTDFTLSKNSIYKFENIICIQELSINDFSVNNETDIKIGVINSKYIPASDYNILIIWNKLGSSSQYPGKNVYGHIDVSDGSLYVDTDTQSAQYMGSTTILSLFAHSYIIN